MRRRQLVPGTAAWSVVGRAQQQPVVRHRIPCRPPGGRMGRPDCHVPPTSQGVAIIFAADSTPAALAAKNHILV